LAILFCGESRVPKPRVSCAILIPPAVPGEELRLLSLACRASNLELIGRCLCPADNVLEALAAYFDTSPLNFEANPLWRRLGLVHEANSYHFSMRDGAPKDGVH
jgi:hypothetical protein